MERLCRTNAQQEVLQPPHMLLQRPQYSPRVKKGHSRVPARAVQARVVVRLLVPQVARQQVLVSPAVLETGSGHSNGSEFSVSNLRHRFLYITVAENSPRIRLRREYQICPRFRRTSTKADCIRPLKCVYQRPLVFGLQSFLPFSPGLQGRLALPQTRLPSR